MSTREVEIQREIQGQIERDRDIVRDKDTEGHRKLEEKEEKED